MALVDILNAVRANAGTEYQTRIPVATATNLSTIATLLGTYAPEKNPYIPTLFNTVGMQIIDTRTFNNPLAKLKKGSVPYGTDVADIMANPAKAKVYDAGTSDLLTVASPDIKACYYRLNRQDKYEVTINPNMAKQSITNMSVMSEMISLMTSTLYSGDNTDEFIIMKKLVAMAVASNHVVKQQMTYANDEASARALAKAIVTDSKMMKFQSPNYNLYKTISGDAGDAVQTFCPVENQIILMDARVSTSLNFDVLAYAFHEEKMNMPTVIEVDDFIDQPVQALLCDEAFFQCRDNLRENSSQFLADSLSTKLYLHHWQTMGYRTFANAKAYTYDATDLMD